MEFEAMNIDSTASSPHTAWVRPTLLQSEIDAIFPLPLRGTDLNFDGLSIMLILCGSINATRATRALVETLNYYPHIASRLQNDEGNFSLIEGKAGIPMTFVETNEAYNHYNPQAEAPPHLFDIVKFDENIFDQPLCRLRVTFCHATNETYIGLSFGHVLGDGGCVYQFLHVWSQYYQGSEPIFGRPSWDKYKTAPPDADLGKPDTVDFIDRYLPNFKVSYPIPKFLEMSEEVVTSSERTDILFTASQIRHIHQIANAWPGKAGFSGSLSTQDSLAAYIITIYNQCVKEPTIRVLNVLSHRGVKNPGNLKDSDWRAPDHWAAGNAISLASTPSLSPEEAKSVGAIAWNTRKSINDAREYNHLKRMVSVTNPIWGRMAREQEWPKLWLEDGLLLNGIGKLLLPRCHFGFGPEKTRFLLYETVVGYVRFLAASPVRLADGSWHSNEGGIWVALRLPNKIREKFMATLSLELNSPIFPQNLIQREKKLLVTQGINAKL